MNEKVNIIIAIVLFGAGVFAGYFIFAGINQSKINKYKESLAVTRSELQKVAGFTEESGEGIIRIEKLHRRIENLVAEERALQSRIAELTRSERQLYINLESRSRETEKYLKQDQNLIKEIRNRNREAIKIINEITP